VQVVVALLARADGEQDTELIWVGALTLRVKLWVTPFRLALRTADVFVLTVAVKEPLVWLAAIATPLGTVMLALLLDNATVTPPVGAGADNVTVQVEVPGATTVPGEQLRLLGTALTLRLTLVVWLWPLSVAVMVAVWLLPTVPLVAVNVALLCPVGTVMFAGTGNAVALLVSETVTALEVV
jgi:hypothetical protein